MSSEPAASRSRSGDEDFRRRWAAATAVVALTLTVTDAMLLQRGRSFFTGGFLSVDHVESVGQAAAFLAASFLVDAAVAGTMVALALWAASRARLRVTAAILAAACGGALPLLVADAVSYRIVQYLGDAFDLGLMFDLTGGSVREILAVAATYLLAPAAMILSLALGAAACVWAVNRYTRGPRAVPAGIRALAVVPVSIVIGIVILAAAVRANAALDNGLLRKPSGVVLALVSDELTDVDRDGFGLLSRLSDPDPFNASVFPYAADIPGNGIDEDGLGGDLPLDAAPYDEAAVSLLPWARRPDVVMIVLESFRADVVGARYNERPVTPAMDALTSRGVSLAHAYSHNGYTVQSRYHLLTGALTHPSETLSIVDDFRRNGYVTGYFSGQDESFGGSDYSVGFERADVASDARSDARRRYSTSTTPGSLAVPYTVVQEHVTRFLDEHGAAQTPLFLYVNFHDTHFPYWHESMAALTTPTPLPRERIQPDERDALWATYTNAAANVDRAVGQVLEAVRRARGVEPGVIVTGDHGESLFDEGFLGHGYALNDVQTRIPLIVANLPMIVAEPFGQIDLRGALDAALRLPAEAPAAPVVRAGGALPVFQYLGNISRPRQIALLEKSERIIYDFRTRRVQVHGAWRSEGELGPDEHAAFLRLIRRWESMNLKQRAPADDVD